MTVTYYYINATTSEYGEFGSCSPGYTYEELVLGYGSSASETYVGQWNGTQLPFSFMLIAFFASYY